MTAGGGESGGGEPGAADPAPPLRPGPLPAAPPPRGAPGPAKLRDAALVLPVLGAFLLIPPFTDIFAAPLRLGGIPLIVLYIFGVWLALILAALWLSRRLRRLEPPPPEETEPEEAEPPGGVADWPAPRVGGGDGG